MKLATVVLACLLALGSLADNSLAAPEAPPEKQEVTFRVVRADSSHLLDPPATATGGDALIIRLMYECLVRPSESTPIEWQPCLAESWEANEDCTSWTFKLRKKVKFHDGAEFTADAVVRSLNRARGADESTAPVALPYAPGYMNDIESVTAADAHTVVVVLKQANAKFLTIVGMFMSSIVSPFALDHLKTIDSARDRQSWLTRNPAGTGPFQMRPVRELDGRSLKLAAFEDYWGGAPSVDHVSIQTESESRSRMELLRAGEADFMTGVLPDQREQLAEAKSATLAVRPGENLAYLAMNCSKQAARPTADLKLRKAIALAIRRQAYVDLYHGAAEPLFGLLPPTVTGYVKDFKPAGDELEDDAALKRAKAILDDIGLPEQPLKMLIPAVPRPYLTKPTETAELIKQQLAAVGIKVDVEAQPMYEIATAAEGEDYDLLLIGWMGETGVADNFYGPLLGGIEGRPGSTNFARFWNEELVKQVDAAGKEPSAEKRLATFQSFEKTVFDNHRPLVPLYTTTMAEAWRTEWTGIKVDACGYWRFEEALKR